MPAAMILIAQLRRCKALKWALAALVILAPILAAFRAGSRSGAAQAEAANTKKDVMNLKEIADVQERMLEAAADRPADRGALAGRLRGGRF